MSSTRLERQARAGGAPTRISERALKALDQYDFPGNVRELENILERAVALCSDDVIDVDELQLSPPALDGEYRVA